MIKVDQLEKLLENLSLSDLNILTLEIPKNIENGYAIQVDSNALHTWKTLRTLVPQTGMWPVLYAFWGNPQNTWEDYVNADNIFSRQPFEWENQEEKDTSPESIVARAEITSFEGLLENHANMYSENLREDFGYSLEKTKQRFGISPQASEIDSLIKTNQIQNYIELEKWLLDWELQNIPIERSLPPSQTQYIEWYVPHNEPQALILLPTPHCWEVPAYIHWFGAGACGSETAIAMLRWWNEKIRRRIGGSLRHHVAFRRPEKTRKY
ncbi:hypothetical protein [Kaarinaea lacus]